MLLLIPIKAIQDIQVEVFSDKWPNGRGQEVIPMDLYIFW